MSQIKLSEIKRRAQGLQSPVRLAICDLVLNDVPYLLDLVERLGKIIDGLVWHYHCDHHGDLEDCHFHKCKEGHALLKELEL